MPQSTIDRRGLLLLGGAGVLSLAVPKAARAAPVKVVGNAPDGTPILRAAITSPKRVVQECAEWCWAASLSMVFDALGHPIDQKKIVIANFGQLACAPASTTLRIAANLSGRWVDSNGTAFASTVTAAYDPTNGISAINNGIIVQELINDRPLLYANTHHAMVVVGFDFIDSPMGPQPVNVFVLDPWPMSPGLHPLSGPEMVGMHMGGEMMFLASVATRNL